MKRGRKDVYTASGCEAMRIAYIGEEISARTRQARFYQYTAKALLAEAASDFPEIKAVYHHDTVHRQEHEKPEILEQIGRMYMQGWLSPGGLHRNRARRRKRLVRGLHGKAGESLYCKREKNRTVVKRKPLPKFKE